MKPTVAIFGASVRWLAQSAASAGFNVLACDLFADEDLRECAKAKRILRSEYPDGFKRIADEWRGVPRVYTGGLENVPDVVASFKRAGPLWGCTPESLRRCRTPSALGACGLETPAWTNDPSGVPSDGSWLLKPLRGSGGFGIKPWLGDRLPPECTLQQRAPGEPVSASFLALKDRTVFIGASSQFIGQEWTGAPDFAYAGGVAPLSVSSEATNRLHSAGESIRQRFNLRGLFGVDAIRNRDDWVFLEINPRPTASMELFECASAGSMFALHHSAFGGDSIELKSCDRLAGKAICYATHPCQLVECPPSTNGSIRFCDRPSAGTKFQSGDPIATTMACGRSTEEVVQELKRGVEFIARQCKAVK